jgi:hypothetical protein
LTPPKAPPLKAARITTAVIERRQFLPPLPTSQSFKWVAFAGCQSCRAASRKRRRQRQLLSGIFFAMVPILPAEDFSSAAPNLISKDTRLWTESMLWSEAAEITSGIGYRDNILLSPFHPQGSGFFVNGLDFMTTRLPLDGWQIVGSVVGSDTHFWNDAGARREDLLHASGRVERELPGGWQAGLELRGQYEDQVLDISTSQGTPATALVEGEGFTVQPTLKKILPAGVSLKVELPIASWNFESPLDNYSELGPVLTAAWSVKTSTEISMSYSYTDQPHDAWLALDAYGGPLPQRLEIQIQKIELAWDQSWDASQHWHTSTRLIYPEKQDNGGGFFNYDEYEVVEDFRWRTDNWQIQVSGLLAYEDYPVQTSVQHGSQTLYRNTLDLSLEAERRIYKNLKTYAQLDYQRALSNEILGAGNYHSATVSGGLRYEF